MYVGAWQCGPGSCLFATSVSLEGHLRNQAGIGGAKDAVNGLKALDSGPSSSGSLLELPHQAKAAVGRNSFGGDAQHKESMFLESVAAALPWPKACSNYCKAVRLQGL